MKARCTVLAILLACAPLAASDALPEVDLVEVNDLARDGALIRRQGTPMMLEFASADCSYCMVLEEELLKPMLRNAGYRERVLIRKIDIDASGYIRDFDGTRISSDELVDRYGVDFTPTLVFLDASGAEISARIVGVQSMDFFGATVDEAIDTSYRRLQSTAGN